MLSEAQRAIIKATVPLLETGGETLTKHFYHLMLTSYPEVRPLFNQAHQASGDQPRALANGVLAYARHIDKLEALGPLVQQVVHKHVSLQVLPEHYPIVGTCLLQAIREVLGPEIATDEVVAAWAAAYQQLADILIQAEEAVYQANANQAGGWRGARRFRVARRADESEEITSFYLQPLDGKAVPAYVPGQYLGLRLTIDGKEVRRNYSLSAPPDGTQFRISVKREPGGQVSNHLHEHAMPGFELDVFPPAGEFTLRDSTRPIAFITAGVGITPAIPMLEAAARAGRTVHFIHCARHAGVHAFRDWVDDMTRRYPSIRRYFCYSEPRAEDKADGTGLLSREQLEAWLPATRDVDAYFLGPTPFMALVKKHLAALGIPQDQCHYEFFGPAQALES